MWYIGTAAGENYGKLAGWLAMAMAGQLTVPRFENKWWLGDIKCTRKASDAGIVIFRTTERSYRGTGYGQRSEGWKITVQLTWLLPGQCHVRDMTVGGDCTGEAVVTANI